MKGMLYTVEAVLGAVIILIGITIILPTQQVEASFAENAYYCLKYLDQRGLLRYYAVNEVSIELNNNLKSCLPSILDFKFKICSTSDCREIAIPYDKTVYLTSYLIAGENAYERKLINVWVWLK